MAQSPRELSAPPRSRALLVALLSFALWSASAAQPPAFDGALDDIRAVLAARGESDDRGEEQVLLELVELGPDLAPALFELSSSNGFEALLARAGDDARWGVAPDRIPILALEVLGRFPANEVVEALERGTRYGTNEDALRALRVLAELASSEGVSLTFDLAERIGEVSVHHPRFREPLIAALTAPLREDDLAWRAARERVSDIAPHVAPLLIAAVERAGRAHGFDLLAGLAGRDGDVDLALASAVTELGARYPWLLLEDAVDVLEPWLVSLDPRLRAAAADGLARLARAASLSEVASLLDDDDATVRLAARRALERVYGSAPGGDSHAWKERIDAQLEWWNDVGRQLASDPETLLPARMASFARELQRRPFAHAEAARVIAESLWTSDPEAVAAAAPHLAAIRSARAVPGLIDALREHVDPVARAAALAALRALTGVDLPESPPADSETWPASWEDYLRG